MKRGGRSTPGPAPGKPPTTQRVVRRALVALFLILHLVVLSVSLGLASRRVLPLGFGLSLAVLGNVLGLVRPNLYLGTRLPPTMREPAVWRRTHRATGYLMTGTGVLMALVAIIGGDWAFFGLPIGVLVMVLGSVGYAVLASRTGRMLR